MRGPHALAAGKHPCFRDYKWFHETGDPIAYTTAKHHAINSLERRIREKITEQWEILTQYNTYLSDYSSKILPLILQFIRVAPINLNLRVGLERVRNGPSVGGSFAATWARMVLKRCSSEHGEREKRFYKGGKGERRRTAF